MASRRGHRSLTAIVEPVVESEANDGLAGLAEEVDLALAQLACRQRQAFELFHRHGMGYQAIAIRMGHPVGTIKTWIHRARLQLIQQLQDREVVYLDRRAANTGHGANQSHRQSPSSTRWEAAAVDSDEVQR